MTKGKKKDVEGGEAAPPRPGPFDDMPYAEESPAVQDRPPPVAGAQDLRSGPGATDVDGPSDGDTAVVAAEMATSELTDEAVAEAALIVQNDLSGLERERDEYLDGLRRVQAEFENYRKRVIQQQSDHAERATQDLVSHLLPVLDACEAAVQHGAADVVPVQAQLLDSLVKQGLEALLPDGEPFDPNFHDAVMHEAADDGDTGGSVVAEVLRTGYSWKGRVLRPAMVKVKG